MPTNLQRLLSELGACREALSWAGTRTAAEFWRDCQRSDWMLWLLSAVGYDDEQVLREFGCWCVRQVWDLLDDPRSRAAVEVAERYARGEATADELGTAYDDALAAASDADVAARTAAWAASIAADWVASHAAMAAWSAYATARAAQAAAGTADEAAMAAAEAVTWTASRAAQADRLREVVPVATVEQLAAAAMAAAEEAGR